MRGYVLAGDDDLPASPTAPGRVEEQRALAALREHVDATGSEQLSRPTSPPSSAAPTHLAHPLRRADDRSRAGRGRGRDRRRRRSSAASRLLRPRARRAGARRTADLAERAAPTAAPTSPTPRRSCRSPSAAIALLAGRRAATTLIMLRRTVTLPLGDARAAGPARRRAATSTRRSAARARATSPSSAADVESMRQRIVAELDAAARGARAARRAGARARALQRRAGAVRLRRLARPAGAAAQGRELLPAARAPLRGPARRARRPVHRLRRRRREADAGS